VSVTDVLPQANPHNLEAAGARFFLGRIVTCPRLTVVVVVERGAFSIKALDQAV
jgi:hypothetical protein